MIPWHVYGTEYASLDLFKWLFCFIVKKKNKKQCFTLFCQKLYYSRSQHRNVFHDWASPLALGAKLNLLLGLTPWDVVLPNQKVLVHIERVYGQYFWPENLNSDARWLRFELDSGTY